MCGFLQELNFLYSTDAKKISLYINSNLAFRNVQNVKYTKFGKGNQALIMNLYVSSYDIFQPYEYLISMKYELLIQINKLCAFYSQLIQIYSVYYTQTTSLSFSLFSLSLFSLSLTLSHLAKELANHTNLIYYHRQPNSKPLQKKNSTFLIRYQ